MIIAAGGDGQTGSGCDGIGRGGSEKGWRELFFCQEIESGAAIRSQPRCLRTSLSGSSLVILTAHQRCFV